MEQSKDIPVRSSPRKWNKSSKPTDPDNNITKTRSPDINANTNHNINSSNKKREYRRIRERRHQKKGCCHNAEQCKGLGAVLFTLGIPSSIAGVILTVVAATDDDNDSKYPDSFLAVGPILLVFAVIFFCSGLCLYKSYLGCFSLDDPNSFCRVHCKKLSHCLKPDENIMINQAAMKALQTQPGKPALKRCKQPSVSSASMDGNGLVDDSLVLETVDENNLHNSHPTSKGVRFSVCEIDEIGKGHHSGLSDSGSMLSLRHCKIYPKDKEDRIWWSDEASSVDTTSVSKPLDDLTTDL